MSNWETMVNDICEKKVVELGKPIIPSISDVDNKAIHEFPTGAKRDIQDDKGRCDLLPLDVVADILDSDPYIALIDEFMRFGNVITLVTLLKCYLIATYGSIEEGFLELSIHFREGAKKYGIDNWKIGIPIRSYISSAVRHRIKMIRGDTDERHDRAFAWNIICAIWTMANKPECIDL